MGVERMSNAFFGLGLSGAKTNVKSHPGRDTYIISMVHVQLYASSKAESGRYLLTSSAISGQDQIPLTIKCNPIAFYHLIVC